MSVRLARLLSIALIGVCFVTAPAFAKTTHARTTRTKASAPAKGPTLIWRGDVATATGVVNEVALAWQKSGKGNIELQPFNTASGIDAVAIGTADLAGSARASDGSAQNTNLTFTPVAWDALVIITNASNPVSNLSLKQVHDIYYGKITNWSQVGGSNAPIDVYAVASPGDGVEYSLRDLLFGRGNQPVAAPRLYVNTHKLEEGVELNPNGLGAATMADISGNPKLKAVAIDGNAPTSTNIANGSYLLFTPLYLVTNPRSPKAAEVQAFIDFLQTEPAKAAMRKHAVLPYQDGIALASMEDTRRNQIFAELGVRPSRLATTPNAGVRADASIAAVSTLAAAQSRTATGNPATTTAPSTVSAPQTSSTDVAATSSSTTSADTTHTVVKGDTLSTIAKKHDVSVAQLREWNHLKGDQIKLGQVLRVSDR
ncbi:substrate-binding domain-containing protein [Rhodanobacter sp. C03]|uniref:LysM peptidoglycan-binding domain-containing protein n=1 Tax=Rhodanobacter sp. C03 TaxID=1945858 RepID=UPI0009863750|nr:substrate-binding domain-containing protein [Rhodanobacter sp. C03]OOG53358.1 peptidoglycan-binding protein [Rhodanobacter sp. C03]